MTTDAETSMIPTTPDVLEAELLAHPDLFSYFQVVSLLRRIDRIRTDGDETEEHFLRSRLRVDGYLSLGFPPNDVLGVTVVSPDGETKPAPDFAADERIRLVATFMGLYGSASPLPTFYTEELLDDAREDRTAAKSFLDLVGQRFFIHYYQALGKYRLLDRIVSEEDRSIEERLFCLLGVGDAQTVGGGRAGSGELGCTGLFSLRQRSASGLGTYLAERFGVAVEDVAVRQCVVTKVVVPEEQRTRLGLRAARLGEEALVGGTVVDGMGAFRVDIRRMGAERYRSCLPGRAGWKDLMWALSFYVTDPLEFEVRLHVNVDEVEVARLGGRAWNELGGDMFLGGAGLGGGDRTGCRLKGVADCSRFL